MAAPRPEHAHATDRPATATLPPRPAHTTTGWRQDRRPVVSKRPLHSLAAAKMSPHIHIGPEPVLAAHARSPPAAGSRCPAGADSAPQSEPIFFITLTAEAVTPDVHLALTVEAVQSVSSSQTASVSLTHQHEIILRLWSLLLCLQGLVRVCSMFSRVPFSFLSPFPLDCLRVCGLSLPLFLTPLTPSHPQAGLSVRQAQLVLFVCV